jgi:hypothetical protein
LVGNIECSFPTNTVTIEILPCTAKKLALREGENLPHLTGNPALIFPATCPDFFVHQPCVGKL